MKAGVVEVQEWSPREKAGTEGCRESGRQACRGGLELTNKG